MDTAGGRGLTQPEPAGRTIRVALIDDHEMVAAGLAAALGDETGIEVVGVASTIEDAEQIVARAHPDVVVMDYRLRDGDGADGTRRVHRIDPEVGVVILTAATDDRALADALAAGCCGFLNKGGPLHDLVRAVQAAADGEAAFPADVVAGLARLGALPAPAPGSDLTSRELEVLRALGGGRSTTEIAAALALSEHTVRNHVSNILAKLGAHTKLQAVVVAARAGLIDVFE